MDEVEKKWEAPGGLLNVRAFTFLVLWYLFSLLTLFMNKYILAFREGDAAMLGSFQMVMTTVLGFVQMYVPLGMYKLSSASHRTKSKKFWGNMVLVGSCRFATIYLGLVALDYVAVSFTETVKSSAPIFTVMISWFALGEASSPEVIASTLPIMGGLALCSATELTFNFIGFLAALGANLTECFQNVYSKMLLSGENYNPAELQFYTSISSVALQIPFLALWGHLSTVDWSLFASYLLNGAFFHFQSITAYVLMGYISPVTHSVANTVKRALLIWLSILVFHNEVSFLSMLGTFIVIVGVFFYNQARSAPKNSVTSHVV